jgi:hypothetical protein
MHRFSCLLIVALAVVFLPFLRLAAEDGANVPERLAVGGVVPALAGKDQHGQDCAITDDLRWILVACEMEPSKSLSGWLAKQGAEYLPVRKALFIADVYPMPSIGRMFAFPKMRRYPHRIMLADEEHLLDPFPRQPGKITVLRLDPGRKIVEIRYWEAADGAPLPDQP